MRKKEEFSRLESMYDDNLHQMRMIKLENKNSKDIDKKYANYKLSIKFTEDAKNLIEQMRKMHQEINPEFSDVLSSSQIREIDHMLKNPDRKLEEIYYLLCKLAKNTHTSIENR